MEKMKEQEKEKEAKRESDIQELDSEKSCLTQKLDEMNKILISLKSKEKNAEKAIKAKQKEREELDRQKDEIDEESRSIQNETNLLRKMEEDLGKIIKRGKQELAKRHDNIAGLSGEMGGSDRNQISSHLNGENSRYVKTL